VQCAVSGGRPPVPHVFGVFTVVLSCILILTRGRRGGAPCNTSVLTFLLALGDCKWIHSLVCELFFLPRAARVRPPACHPLRSWPAGARAATVSATLRPALAGRAADIDFLILYLLSTLALLAPLFVPPWPTVSRVRSSLAPCFRLVLSHVIRSELLKILCNLVKIL